MPNRILVVLLLLSVLLHPAWCKNAGREVEGKTKELKVSPITPMWKGDGFEAVVKNIIINKKTGLGRSPPKWIILAGVDCPEEGQPYAVEAKDFTEQRCKYTRVTIKDYREVKDELGMVRKYVGTVVLPDGKVLNRELIKVGLAWYDARNSNDPELAELEKAARKRKVGLWADPEPIAPWVFAKAGSIYQSKAGIDRDNGYLFASGTGEPPQGIKNRQQRRLMASRKALVNAQRALLRIIKQRKPELGDIDMRKLLAAKPFPNPLTKEEYSFSDNDVATVKVFVRINRQ